MKALIEAIRAAWTNHWRTPDGNEVYEAQRRIAGRAHGQKRADLDAKFEHERIEAEHEEAFTTAGIAHRKRIGLLKAEAALLEAEEQLEVAQAHRDMLQARVDRFRGMQSIAAKRPAPSHVFHMPSNETLAREIEQRR